MQGLEGHPTRASSVQDRSEGAPRELTAIGEAILNLLFESLRNCTFMLIYSGINSLNT